MGRCHSKQGEYALHTDYRQHITKVADTIAKHSASGNIENTVHNSSVLSEWIKNGGSKMIFSAQDGGIFIVYLGNPTLEEIIKDFPTNKAPAYTIFKV